MSVNFAGAGWKPIRGDRIITLKQDGHCRRCWPCDVSEIKAGEQALWAGPGTGRIKHLTCPPLCDDSGGEMCYGCFKYELIAEHQDAIW